MKRLFTVLKPACRVLCLAGVLALVASPAQTAETAPNGSAVETARQLLGAWRVEEARPGSRNRSSVTSGEVGILAEPAPLEQAHEEVEQRPKWSDSERFLCRKRNNSRRRLLLDAFHDLADCSPSY